MEKEFNLIQQLQTTPKWKEFEEWYKNKYMNIEYASINDLIFEHRLLFYHFDEWKGVFEKFISKDNLNITVDGYLGNETYGIGSSFTEWNWFENFEQLLIWYFNN